jgi:uncharacterized protein YecT (DUF1311 family)
MVAQSSAPINQPFKHSMRIIIIISAFLSILLFAGCSKTNEASKIVEEIASPWTLKESKDKMTDAKIISAELQQKSEEHPMVTIDAKVLCKPTDGEAGFYVEITTYSSVAAADGTLKGMPIEFSSPPLNSPLIARLALISGGLLPAGFPYGGHASTNIRINEGQSDNEILTDVPGFRTEYNNNFFLFPFHTEGAAKVNIKSMRVSIPTTQGSPNILIDFADPNIHKVVAACADIRKQIQARAQLIREANAPASQPVDIKPPPLTESIPNIVTEPQSPTSSAPSKQASAAQELVESEDSSFAPSFNCKNASRGMEVLICKDRELSRLDVELSMAYTVAKEKSNDNERLKAEQIEWIRNSARACSDKECLIGAYKNRLAQLKNSPSGEH